MEVDDLAHRIFGSDDDDDDFVADAGQEGLDEDDVRAREILASKQPKRPTKRKRLEKGGRAKQLDEPPEDRVEVVDAYEDADKDSIEGSEAMEDNTHNETDENEMMVKKSRRRGAPLIPRPALDQEVRDLTSRMEEAARKDEDLILNGAEKPAVAKVTMLPEVLAIMRKNHYHDALVENGILIPLSQWLQPYNGQLPSLEIRRGVLKALAMLPVDSTIIGPLRNSGIGKYVKLLTLHPKETPENKRLAHSLVEKWTRVIFHSSTVATASKLTTVAAPRVPEESQQDSQSLDGEGSASQPTASRCVRACVRVASIELGAEPTCLDSSTHARVPRPMGMDFSLLPASTVVPMPSNKHAKDSVKGRLADRIGSSKRKVQSQAASLSIEGRGIDKL